MFGYMHTQAGFMIYAACTCPVSQQTGCAKHTGWDPVGFGVLFRVSVDLAHHCHPPLTIQARILHVPRPMGGTWPKPDAKLHPLLESNMYRTSLPCRGTVLCNVLEGRVHMLANGASHTIVRMVITGACCRYSLPEKFTENHVSSYQLSEAIPHWSF